MSKTSTRDGWRAALIVVAALAISLLAGCASRGADGSTSITCSGFFEDLSDCVEKADKLCWKKGGYVARWHDNDPEGRRMRVRCADELK